MFLDLDLQHFFCILNSGETTSRHDISCDITDSFCCFQAEGGMTQRSGSVPSLNSKGRHSISTQGKTDKTDGLDYVSAESFPCGKPGKLSNIFK